MARDRIAQLIAIQALYSYFSAVRGIDISDVMVEKYNQAARLQGLSKQQMYAVQGDLQLPTVKVTHPDLHAEDFFGFHVIILSMGLHHIENPQLMLTRLVERLSDGGAVIVIDWVLEHETSGQQPAKGGGHDVTHDQGGHSNKHGRHQLAHHTVSHAGFNEDQMHQMLREAGCSEVDYVLHPEPSRIPLELGEWKQLFFARGGKNIAANVEA